MKAFNIYIMKYDWLVRVYVGVHRLNTSHIMRALSDFGCSGADLDNAVDLLYKGRQNTGLCFSNRKERMSVMVISTTTSSKEFFDSVVHEISHLSCHIATEYGLDLQGEELCYLAGDVAKMVYPYVKDLLCCGCH